MKVTLMDFRKYHVPCKLLICIFESLVEMYNILPRKSHAKRNKMDSIREASFERLFFSMAFIFVNLQVQMNRIRRLVWPTKKCIRSFQSSVWAFCRSRSFPPHIHISDSISSAAWASTLFIWNKIFRNIFRMNNDDSLRKWIQINEMNTSEIKSTIDFSASINRFKHWI